VWNTIDVGLSSLSNILAHHDDNNALKNRFNKFICKQLEPIAERLGWSSKQGEDIQVQQLRSVILNRLARVGHEPTINTAIQKFREHVDKKVDLEPDLRKMIYSTAARTNDQRLIDDLKQIFETVNFSEVETNCIVALAQVTDPELLTQVFEYGIVKKNFRPQDYMYVFAGCGTSKVGQEFAWSYLQQNYQKLLEVYGSVNSAMFQRCFTFSTSNQCSEAVAKEFESFCASQFGDDERSCLDMTIRQCLESVRNNVRLKGSKRASHRELPGRCRTLKSSNFQLNIATVLTTVLFKNLFVIPFPYLCLLQSSCFLTIIIKSFGMNT